MERRVRHKKNSCEYAITLNTLHTNKLPLQPPGFLVPQTQNAYDSLNHLLHYDLAVSCAIHTYSYKIHNVHVHNTHLEQWTVYSLTYIPFVHVHYGNMQHAHTVACTSMNNGQCIVSPTYVSYVHVDLGNMQHVLTVAYTTHICTRCALHAGVYMLTAQGHLVLPRWSHTQMCTCSPGD